MTLTVNRANKEEANLADLPDGLRYAEFRRSVSTSGARSLSNSGLIDCAGGTAADFSHPFRQIVMTILVKRSKTWRHSPTLLATIAHIRQAPRAGTLVAGGPEAESRAGGAKRKPDDPEPT